MPGGSGFAEPGSSPQTRLGFMMCSEAAGKKKKLGNDEVWNTSFESPAPSPCVEFPAFINTKLPAPEMSKHGEGGDGKKTKQLLFEGPGGVWVLGVN